MYKRSKALAVSNKSIVRYVREVDSCTRASDFSLICLICRESRHGHDQNRYALSHASEIPKSRFDILNERL